MFMWKVFIEYLIANSVQQCNSLEADSCSGDKVHRVLWSPKVHYRFHNNQSLVCILSEFYPFFILTRYDKMYFNIIFSNQIQLLV
jgi:hypothetical protein